MNCLKSATTSQRVMNSTFPTDKTLFAVVNTSSTTASSFIGMEVNGRRPETVPPNDSTQYFFVPLAALVTVIILSAMVYLMARTKRKVISRMCKKVTSPSAYTLLDVSDFEQDEDNEDNPNECLLAGKLQIENRYDSYPIHSYNNCSRELFA